MAGKSSGAAKSHAPLGIAVGVVILLLLLVGWIAYHNLAPPPFDKIPDNVQSPIATWIRAKAQESGGDLSKLSPEDQQKLQSVTQGKGEAYLKKYAKAPTQ